MQKPEALDEIARNRRKTKFLETVFFLIFFWAYRFVF